MDKQSEIKALQSLKGDTYFNQFFTEEDIDVMCRNIENDFVIECDVEKLEAVKTLAEKNETINRLDKKIANYEEEVVRHGKDMDDLVHFIADQAQRLCSHELRDKAIELMGEVGYIKYCLSKGYSLWKEDNQILIEIL